MFLLDTDTLSRLYAGDARLRERVTQLDPSFVATSVVTRIEIVQGRFDYLLKASTGDELLRAMAWLERSEELLGHITVLPITELTANRFDHLRTNKKLKKIGRADLLIAATALAYDATQVTRNLRHFRQIPGLKVENWIDS
jgi:tRNA(fMet)-specific endonuclease VapC